MPASPSRLVESFRAVGLVGVDLAAALQDRVDIKYVISLEQFAALAERLRDTHVVLEIDGRRAFGYCSTYFDTAELTAFRDHIQQRRRRYKCRSREYVDSGLCTFEVKLKGTRGRTVKHRMLYDRTWRDEVSEPALLFLRECLERSYGQTPDGELHRTLEVRYTRITLAAPERRERVTFDFDLGFSAPDGAGGRLAEDTVIVESKSPRGNAIADRELRALGARPERLCSKYCLGIGLTRPNVKNNMLRPLLRRYFRAAPAAVAPALIAAALVLGSPAPAAADEPRIEIHAAKTIRDDHKALARLVVGGRAHRIRIELRGQLAQRDPTKSYAIETDRRVRLLGMPAERDWDLNASYADPP